MPIDDTYRRKCDYAVQAVAESTLSPSLKEDLTDILGATLEATNGYTQDEKLQKTCENMFNLSRLIVLDIASRGRHPTTWKDVLVRIIWPVVVMFTVLCVTLILKPELASLVETLTQHLHP